MKRRFLRWPQKPFQFYFLYLYMAFGASHQLAHSSYVEDSWPLYGDRPSNNVPKTGLSARIHLSFFSRFHQLTISSDTQNARILSNRGLGIGSLIDLDLWNGYALLLGYSYLRINLQSPPNTSLLVHSNSLSRYEFGLGSSASKSWRIKLTGVFDDKYRVSQFTSSQINLERYRSSRLRGALELKIFKIGTNFRVSTDFFSEYILARGSGGYKPNSGFLYGSFLRIGSPTLNFYLMYQQEKQKDSSFSYKRKDLDLGVRWLLNF